MKRALTTLFASALITTGFAAPATAQPYNPVEMTTRNMSSSAESAFSDMLGMLVSMGILPTSAFRASYGDRCDEPGARARDIYGKQLECTVAGEAGLTWMPV